MIGVRQVVRSCAADVSNPLIDLLIDTELAGAVVAAAKNLIRLISRTEIVERGELLRG